MNYFDFSLKSLEEAFRLLCSKLYFKAEAQEIDRILEAFAYRYWIQNATDPIYLHADIVYAITYSIMLLNTDLYVIQSNSHTKMSCASFCENLMSTLNEFGLELNQETTTERLKEIYFSIKQQGILQPQNGPKSFLKRIGSRRVKSPQQTF
ncbi:hypothetical protein G6F56_011778 [Rhizopus delemar]|nr:hypothetical protein G6F56_011778 [Rhizopus delemar]